MGRQLRRVGQQNGVHVGSVVGLFEAVNDRPALNGDTSDVGGNGRVGLDALDGHLQSQFNDVAPSPLPADASDAMRPVASSLA